MHRRLGADDIYFVTNLQLEASQTAVTFRVTGKIPERWDPMTGEIAPVLVYRTRAAGVEIPIRLPARASMCILFRAGQPQPHLTETNLEEVRDLTERRVEGIVSHNGEAHVTAVTNGQSKTVRVTGHGLAGAARSERHLADDDRGVSLSERLQRRGYAVEVVDRRSTDGALLGHRTLRA